MTHYDQKIWVKGFGIGLLILHFIAFFLIMVYAPLESTMGLIQKIFYYHVPIAWSGFLAFFITFIYSALYLWKRSPDHDRIARVSAEIGLMFTTLVLITGPIWARFTWGRYWTWEPRLTTSFILFLLYLGYILLRRFGGHSENSARLVAVLGIIAFLDVPLVYFSMHWWSPEVSAHPQNIGLAPEMKIAFFFSLATFTLTYIFILLERLHQAKLEDAWLAQVTERMNR